MRRWSADRVAGVRAQSHLAEIRRDRGGGAAARTGGHAIRRVRILRVAGKNRVHRLVRAERELRHVGFGEYDRACLADAPYQKGIFIGYETLKGKRPGCRRQVDRLEVVFDDHRNTVQWSGDPFSTKAYVERVRNAQRRGIDDHDRIEGGSILVVGIDAPEVLLDERS